MSNVSLKRNTLFNLAGSLMPMLVSLATVPLYLKTIGDARYGVLAIVWIFLGYFGVFDLGLSRSAANQIAKLHGRPVEERQAVFWTALWLNLGFGVVGGVALYALAGYVLGNYFNIPPGLRAELFSVLPWLAAAVPFATASGVLVGTLEGEERFKMANVLQVLGTFAFQIAPLAAVLAFGPALGVLLPTAVVVRMLNGIVMFVAVVKILRIRRIGLPVRERVGGLLGYGAWVSVTGLIGPLLESLERMLLGSVLGVQAVAYYSVPFNLVDRIRIIPAALGRALFPRLSKQEGGEAIVLAKRSYRFVSVAMSVVIAPALVLIGPFLTLWVGADFATRSTPVAQIILIGIWFNAPAFVPLLFIQAQGRPDVVAKIHAAEFLPFLAVLWFCVHQFGLVGAAAAWALRVFADAVLLCLAARLPLSAVLLPGWGGAIVLGSWMIARNAGGGLLASLALGMLAFGTALGVAFAWMRKSEPELLAGMWKMGRKRLGMAGI